MNAESLVQFIENDKQLHDAVFFCVKSLRRTADRAAEAVAKANADWHDDPQADDHKAFHAPADKQFTRATRDKAIKQLVAYWVSELTIQEGSK